jgi:hypothetical protein
MRIVPRALLAALCLAAAVPATSSAAPLLGIADQKADMFTDPAFQALGVRNARVAVAWDVMKTDWQVAELDRWLALAKATGVTPLITWAPSRLAGQRTNWPTVAQFTEQFAKFRAHYPWVTTFSTWNEANFNGFGPWDKPQLAAKWWLALTKACPTCTILGADLHDTPSMVKWAKAFLKAAKKQPKAWGLHNYVSVNRLQTKPITDLLKVVKGRIWLTETGGLVKRRSKSLIKLPEGVANQTKVTKFLLTTIAALPRIDRIYVYQWNSSTATDSWDSSLVGFDGNVRPALAEFTKRLPAGRSPLPPITADQVTGLIGELIYGGPPAAPSLPAVPTVPSLPDGVVPPLPVTLPGLG